MRANVESLKSWLLADRGQLEMPGLYQKKGRASEEHSWYKVMCLSGVDYFSTLGYQRGIAALAAGALSPCATLILVLLTLFGALPIYRRVARESPHGEGSISMLEQQTRSFEGDKKQSHEMMLDKTGGLHPLQQASVWLRRSFELRLASRSR